MKSVVQRSKAEAQPKVRRANKKAEVIDLMRRAGGATLAEIMEATGWQRPGQNAGDHRFL